MVQGNHINVPFIKTGLVWRFEEKIKSHRFWRVIKNGSQNNAEIHFIFSSSDNKIVSLGDTQKFFAISGFADVCCDNKIMAVFDLSTKLLWTNAYSDKPYTVADGAALLKNSYAAGCKGWGLPYINELFKFACDKSNHYRANTGNRLITSLGEAPYWWLGIDMATHLDYSSHGSSSNSGHIFAVCRNFKDLSPIDLAASVLSMGWALKSKSGAVLLGIRSDWENLSIDGLLSFFQAHNYQLVAVDDSQFIVNPQEFTVQFALEKIDYRPCRLPELDQSQISDPEKGLWELWGEAGDVLKANKLVARNPSQDMQNRAVAIDFGTSSTVVAVNTANGGRELLRIGVRDFYKIVEAEDFENPTVIECIDFKSFESAWTNKAYRPDLDWSWMRAAHEAQSNFRENPGQTEILASILPKLKQWALRSDRTKVRMTDRQGFELELSPHAERNPVRGEALRPCKDPFDPIELYAWYLGMAINWRGRGIFLKYYLSFPVKYESVVKSRILASFRRGLQRSLPATLLDAAPEALNAFEVSDLASEPAAYAAAALPRLGVQPTDEGVPYAVFDFGGGTTDFDYGLLRYANSDEEERGYERVFEHLGSSGDNFLGGENLIENLVYSSFQHNLAELRDKRIQFTRPMDAPAFAGSEAFLAPTQAAQTNTVMLASRLRKFMESSQPTLESPIKLDLIGESGEKQLCSLELDAEALDALLLQRIRAGVEAFLAGLAELRSELPSNTPIHILLAGNGSRSRHVAALFDTESAEWKELAERAFGADLPDIEVHPPLPMMDDDPHAPTAKTGVALGLLRLVPGENTLLLDHTRGAHDGQAPFGWFVGKLRRGQFLPVVSPAAAYGHWHELGRLQEGVFNLYFSNSPRARIGLSEGDSELRKERRDFPAAPNNSRLYARATAPHIIELIASDEVPTPETSGLGFDLR